VSVALALVVELSFIYWLFQLVNVIRVIRAMPLLARQPETGPANWPRVSVISTACNEGEHIATALAAKLSDDYPDAEYILVEDRSTDATPAVCDRLAAGNQRLKVVHVTDLPGGWLGKLNALERGRRAATGDWLLFSDADVHFTNRALRRAIAFAERRNIDHLAVLPELSYVNWYLDPVLGLFVRTICLVGQVWNVENPGSETAAGVGAFNLVRREALEHAGGFAPIRMEVADDLSLGRLLKRSGARQSLVNGRGCLSVAIIRTLAEAARSSERATWTEIGRFSIVRLFGMALFLLLAELGVFLGLLPGLPAWTMATGAAGIAISLVTSIVAGAWANGRWLGALLWPYALVLQVVLLVRAGILGVARGGIRWRGTFYPNEVLRRGKRF
jgi:cellulose synthase/poly-beta-1,6-N-acetylglucosamine synthase-like glycosyltransferase